MPGRPVLREPTLEVPQEVAGICRKAALVLARLEPLHYENRAYQALLTVKNNDPDPNVRDDSSRLLSCQAFIELINCHAGGFFCGSYRAAFSDNPLEMGHLGLLVCCWLPRSNSARKLQDPTVRPERFADIPSSVFGEEERAQVNRKTGLD